MLFWHDEFSFSYGFVNAPLLEYEELVTTKQNTVLPDIRGRNLDRHLLLLDFFGSLRMTFVSTYLMNTRGE